MAYRTKTWAQKLADARAKAPSPPWWRVLKTTGELNPKYPGAGAVQRERLEAEGHRIVRKGQRLVVDGFAAKLADLA